MPTTPIAYLRAYRQAVRTLVDHSAGVKKALAQLQAWHERTTAQFARLREQAGEALVVDEADVPEAWRGLASAIEDATLIDEDDLQRLVAEVGSALTFEELAERLTTLEDELSSAPTEIVYTVEEFDEATGEDVEVEHKAKLPGGKR